MKKAIFTSGAPEPIGPYSQAIFINGTLYISGQIPLNAVTGELVTSGIEEETKQVMENIRAILEAAGASFNEVVKCSIFVANMNDFKSINEVYGTYFDEPAPARETVEVSRLPKDVGVEISCIAVL